MINRSHIVVIGNVATGKSTLAKALADKLQGELVPADRFFETNPFFPEALKDRQRWSFTSDTWFLLERLLLMRQALSLPSPQPLVVDSGLLMSYVYAHSRLSQGYMTADEWELYERLFSYLTEEIPAPELVVFLNGPVDFLRQRIEKRGREFEIKYHSAEYLDGISSSIAALVERLRRQGTRCLEIQAEALPAQQIGAVVENFLLTS